MDFQNTNSLNDRLNLFSANLLPVVDNSSFSIFWKLYSAIVWSFELVFAVTLISACFLVSLEKALFDGVIVLVVLLESVFIVIRINTKSTLVQQLIRKLNEALNTEDEDMINIVMTNVKPIEKPFQVYLVLGTFSVITWYLVSFFSTYKQDTFYYKDFRAPATYSKEPFSFGIFLSGSIISLIANIYLFLKKVSVDVYTTHLVSVITAQYQYIALRLVMVFQNRQDNNSFPENNFEDSIEKKIKDLCQQHNHVIHMTFMLKKLLSFNIFLIYLNNVLRFCFLGIMLTKISMSVSAFFNGCVVGMYAFGSIMQFYILCACFHRLSEASSEITDKAFHEDWIRLSLSVKRMFLLMITATNNIDIRLSLFENFNLSLPSFMSIINQSYSIALLILKM